MFDVKYYYQYRNRDMDEDFWFCSLSLFFISPN